MLPCRFPVLPGLFALLPQAFVGQLPYSYQRPPARLLFLKHNREQFLRFHAPEPCQRRSWQFN